MAGLGVPWLAAPYPPSRFLLALVCAVPAIRFFDFAFRSAPLPIGVRIWWAVSPFDVLQTRRVPPSVDLRGVMAALAYGSAAVAAYCVAFFGADARSGLPVWLVRWGGGLVLSYCAIDAVAVTLRVVYRLAGIELPLLHNAPVLSKTVREFWAGRWNRPVHSWLRRHCFSPLARRRMPRLGIGVSFIVSALLHAWLAYVPLGAEMALWMAGFFLIQGAIVLLELSIRVSAWPVAGQRAWTILMLVGTSPLFVEPFMRFSKF